MSIVDIIFPRKCISCGEIADSEKKDVFCPICRAKYEMIKRERCPVCGLAQCKCRCVASKLCKDGMPVTERHIFAFESELSRTLIYKLKRKNLRSLRTFFADECYKMVREEAERANGEELVIVYPPRSKSGIKEYGFDQAHIIASAVAKMSDIPLLKIFRRTHNGKLQKTLSAKQREQNAERVFDISKKADVLGKTVIIIDDVVTSGSTAARLASLAMSRGAKRIIVISVAKT